MDRRSIAHLTANVATALALLGIMFGLIAWGLAVAEEPKGMEDLGLPPCRVEDQVAPDCYWDSDVRGTGEGLSFIVVGGTITYEDGTTRPAED